jgi:hypothetical protein
MDERWHFFVAPYLWGLDWKARSASTECLMPVDVSFGDVLEGLDFASGALRGRSGSASEDLAYRNLGADVWARRGQSGLGADIRSVTTEGILTQCRPRRWKGPSSTCWGARYMKNRPAVERRRRDRGHGTDARPGGRHGRRPLPASARPKVRPSRPRRHRRLGWISPGTRRAGSRSCSGALKTGRATATWTSITTGRGLERRIWQVTYQGRTRSWATREGGFDGDQRQEGRP